jgi:hypothetical protein
MYRKVIVYIACSADGYIALPNDDLSFLSVVEQEGEDYGYAAFIDQLAATMKTAPSRHFTSKLLTMNIFAMINTPITKSFDNIS